MGSQRARRVILAVAGVGLLGALAAQAGAEANTQAGRVEGVLKIGGKVSVGQKMILERNDPPPFRRSGRVESPQTETDEKGRFVFENVETGEWRVGVFKKSTLRNKGGYTLSYTSSHSVAFHLEAGETVKVQIGGTGRPVIGQLTPPKGQDVEIAYQGASFRRVWLVAPRTPCPEGLSTDERDEWYEKFYSSKKGLAEWRAHRSCVIDVAADGSFRIEDVPSGTYTGQIEVARWGEELGRASGSATLKFTVPKIPGGRSNEPLDLGKIEVQFREPDRRKSGDAQGKSKGGAADKPGF